MVGCEGVVFYELSFLIGLN